jgi:thiol-disulfide isomerase/thioredoxin
MFNKIGLFALLLTLVTPLHAANLKPVPEGLPSPDLVLTDLNGNTHNLKDYKGQVVLVQFWATYCGPCRKEMPSMNKMQAMMGDVPFKILAVDMGESKDEVNAFVNEVKPEFTILMDEDGNSIEDWKVFAAPSNFIVGPDGQIKYTLFGGVEWDSEEIIEKLKALNE